MLLGSVRWTETQLASLCCLPLQDTDHKRTISRKNIYDECMFLLETAETVLHCHPSAHKSSERLPQQLFLALKINMLGAPMSGTKITKLKLSEALFLIVPSTLQTLAVLCGKCHSSCLGLLSSHLQSSFLMITSVYMTSKGSQQSSALFCTVDMEDHFFEGPNAMKTHKRHTVLYCC